MVIKDLILLLGQLRDPVLLYYPIKSQKKRGTDIVITGVTTGKIVDYGIKDSMNMVQLWLRPFETIKQNFEDFNIKPDYYDKIITGDLGCR